MSFDAAAGATVIAGGCVAFFEEVLPELAEAAAPEQSGSGIDQYTFRGSLPAGRRDRKKGRNHGKQYFKGSCSAAERPGENQTEEHKYRGDDFPCSCTYPHLYFHCLSGR
jgi:hypothetical protein